MPARQPSLQQIFRVRQKGELDQQAYEEQLTRSVAEVCNSYGEL